MSKSTIATCLADIGVDTALLKSMTRIEDEFALIKKTYFKKALLVHPDKGNKSNFTKGGDNELFRKVNQAFEALREIFEKRSTASFASALGRKAEAKVQNLDRSWDYYNDAFDVSLPIYKVELAKSGRSKCVQKTKAAKKCYSEIIEKGDVRIGSIDLESGSYTRWLHLMCWRVPSRIWLGLPDPEICQEKYKFEEALSSMNEVLFTGFDSLHAADKERIIIHVMDKSHWAKLTHRKGPQVLESTLITDYVKKEKEIIGVLPDSSEHFPKFQGQNQLVPFQQELVPVRGFQMPVKTNQNKNYLLGKTVVLTGVFPEVGGGAGLNLGKDKVKEMVASFGGRVTSAISGKTDYLIVGTSPGFSKVSKARTQPKCQLLSLESMKNAIESGRSESLEHLPPVVVDNFSSGYRGTSTLALDASACELQIAKGLVEVPLQIKPPKRSGVPASSSAIVKKPKTTKKKGASTRNPQDKLKTEPKKTTVKSETLRRSSRKI